MQTPSFGRASSGQSAAGMKDGTREERGDGGAHTPSHEEEGMILGGGGDALINQHQQSSSSTNARDDIGEERSFNAQDYYGSYVRSEEVNNNNRVITHGEAHDDRMWTDEEDESDDEASNISQRDVHLT